MNLAICSCKSSSNTRVPLYDKGRYVEASSKRSAANITGRRRLLLFSTPMIILAAATTEASDSRTALLQKYLKKSDENKEKNDKERLDAYYKRNYKDYFGFVEGTLRAKNEQQLSESEKSILEWLDKNK